MLASFPYRIALLSLVTLLACAGQGCAWKKMSNRTYAEGFEPLREEIVAEMPSDDQVEPNLASGTMGTVFWADAVAVIPADAAHVCEALRRAEVVVNDRSVDNWREVALEEDTAREGVTGFVLENTVKRVVEISFAITWQIADATEENECVARWSLTRGPVFLKANRGWVAVTELDEGLTLVEAQAEIDAPRVDESVPRAYLTLLTEKLREAAMTP